MAWRDQWVSKSDFYRRLTEGGILFIIIALGTVVVGSLYFRSSNAANRVVCAAHLRNLSQAITMYSQENDGLYPPEKNWEIPLVQYVDSLNDYSCPSDTGIRPKKKAEDKTISNVSYWYLKPESDSSDHSSVFVFGDRVYPNYSGNHNLGGNVSYLDGHVRWHPAEQWESEGLPLESYSGVLKK